MAVSLQPGSHQAIKLESGAAESRSTSAGSRGSGEGRRAAAAHTLQSSRPSLAEYEYPVPVVVRNTFIDTYATRSDSLEEFYKERMIHSEPVKDREEMGSEVGTVQESQPLREAVTAGAQAFMAAAAGLWAQPEPTTSAQNVDASRQAPRVLMLAEALQGPVLGSPELPTMGSAGHHTNTCKPCAFFYTKGCENGTQCVFCHLCPPDEKRRRQKEKQEAFREMRKQRRQVRL